MWIVRQRALEALGNELRREEDILTRSFGALDSLVALYNARLNQDAFFRVCGVIVAKARALCHCCYSLILDGHG